MAQKNALVLLAEGVEEIEAVICIDVLRRAEINVLACGIENDNPVISSQDVVIKPDCSLKEALNKGIYDVVVLPGGLKGAENLAQNAAVGSLLKEQEKAGRLIAAICAAPAISLMAHGIGEGKSITCYPSFSDKVAEKYSYKEQDVVVDGNLLTSQGPGTAFKFAFAIIEQLLGKEISEATAKPMLL